MADPRAPLIDTAARPPTFDHLALRELRAYRDELAQEETRIAYCRRVLQVQLVLTREGRRAAGTDSAFQRALARGSRVDLLGASRVNLDRAPVADLPALPNLTELFGGELFGGELSGGELSGGELSGGELSGDETAAGTLLDAERQFAAYQDAVATWYRAATTELIARYRERPALAVRVLPLTPLVQPRPTRY